jgi:tol-pal system protein YbgF
MRQLGAALAASAVLAGCSLTPPEEDPVQLKLNDLDGRVGRIERVVSNQSLLDMAQRLDAAQADVRSLRGRVEELENANEALRKQQRDIFADLDRRMSSASGGGFSGGAAGPGGAPGGAAGEQAAYTQAFDALKSSNYPAAISGFRSYLSSYPNGNLGDNAQYWLGEAYYVTRDYEQAATAFRAVGEKWPNSRKAADALVKLGFSQFELKRFGEARDTLNDVVRRFPDSDAARLATERLRRIPAGAR